MASTKDPIGRKKAPRVPTMAGITVQHGGTELSFALRIKSAEELEFDFLAGSKKSIFTPGKAIDMCCPSIEGTVIVIFFQDGKEGFYDVATGEPIDQAFLDKVKLGERCLPNITLYK